MKPDITTSPEAVAETLRLASAWIAYLLRRQGESTLRVPAADITAALNDLTCSVEKEGDDYVITLLDQGDTP